MKALTKTNGSWRRQAHKNTDQAADDNSSSANFTKSYNDAASGTLSQPSTSLSSFRTSTTPSWNSCFLKPQRSRELTYQSPKSLSTAQSTNLALATLRFEKGKLYGRDKETALLCKVFREAQNRPVILVAGTSGVGKSVFVEKLRGPVKKAGGIFSIGKYDFQQRAVPFAGITGACRKVCNHLIQEKPTEARLNQLRDELGSSIAALSKLLPSLLELVGVETPQQNEEHTGISEAQNRFFFAIGTFVRVVASWAPLIMVLDDMQWADVESFGLLESLMNDPKVKGFILVGCYRSNEIDDAHLMSKFIRDVEGVKGEIALTKIELRELDVDAVNDMLADILSQDPEHTMALANTVHQKTLGNAFFVIQYLKVLQERNILEFSLGLMKWIWSLDEIEAKTEATENVVDLMRKKMDSLPDELREVLPLAACLGSTFTARQLAVVVEEFQHQRGYDQANNAQRTLGATSWLQICAEEGFIESVNDDRSYSWVHDKVQEAALALAVKDKVRTIQFRVGDVLLRSLSQEEISSDIFVIVNLLNNGLGTALVDKTRLLTMAKLNLEAGEAAMASASFVQASEYLKSGITCLPDDNWTTEYDLSLRLFSAAAEAEYCTGDIESLERHCEEIIAQEDRQISDKFRAYNVLIPSIGNRNRVPEACDMLVHVLAELGCTFPKSCQLFFVLRGIMKTKTALKKHKRDNCATITEMTDESKIQAMRMLDQLATFAYFMEGSLLLPLAIFKSFRWSLKYGTSEFSPPTFALVAMILIVKLRDFEAGRTYAEYALSLLGSNLEFEATESRTIFLTHAFTLHQCIPHHMCLKPYLHGYATGLVTGDVESAAWSLYQFLEYSFYSGKALGDMDHDFDVYGKQLKSINQLRQYNFTLYERQVVQNLLGHTDNPFKLKGKIFDIDKLEADRNLVSIVRFRELDLALLMNDDENGAEIACRLKKEYKPEELSPGCCGADFLEVNIGILCYGAARKKKKKLYLSTGKASHKYIKEVAKKGNPNMLNFEALLDAESYALQGKTELAKKLYEKSILLAARRGSVNYQAVANERYADYMTEIGADEEAVYRWNLAKGLYSEWGAVAKVAQIDEKLLGRTNAKREASIHPHPESGD